MSLLLIGCSAEQEPVKEQSRYNNQTLDAGFDTVISLIAYADDETQLMNILIWCVLSLNATMPV